MMRTLVKETEVVCCALGAFIFGPIILALQWLRTRFFGEVPCSMKPVAGGTCTMVAVSLRAPRSHIKSLSLGASVALAMELAIVFIVSAGWFRFPRARKLSTKTFFCTHNIYPSAICHQCRSVFFRPPHDITSLSPLHF